MLQKQDFLITENCDAKICFRFEQNYILLSITLHPNIDNNGLIIGFDASIPIVDGKICWAGSPTCGITEENILYIEKCFKNKAFL